MSERVAFDESLRKRFQHKNMSTKNTGNGPGTLNSSAPATASKLKVDNDTLPKVPAVIAPGLTTNSSAPSGAVPHSSVTTGPAFNPPAYAAPALNLGAATLPLAPYLRISITGSSEWRLEKDKLHEYLKNLVSGLNSKEKTPEEWHAFAQANSLMAGNRPLTDPDKCYIGAKRWVTAKWHGDWEVHLHFGFVNHHSDKHSHIDLAADSKKWLHNLISHSKHWSRIAFKPTLYGDAYINSEETGIQILSRQTFWKTLISKESMSSALAILIPCASFVFKNYEPSDTKHSVINILLAVAFFLGFTLFAAVIRHFLVLPRFSWAVPKLKD